MKKSFDNYRRLAKGRFGMSSLWMGEEYLVFVRGSGFLINFTEHYLRFRYRDIQYLAITKTNRSGGILLHSLGLIFFTGIMAAILGIRDGGPLGVFSIVTLSLLAAGAILFFTLLLRHIFLGPTCFCDLKTSMSRVRMTPLNRLYLTNEAVDLLEEVIREKQKHLATGEDPGDSKLSSLIPPEGERLTIGKTVLPAFIVYTLFGLVGLAALHLESIMLCAVGLGLIVAGNLMTFRSIVSSYRNASPDSIRRLLTTLLSSVMIFGGLALVYFIQIISSNPIYLEDMTAPFDAFVGIPTLGGMVYYFLFLLAILFVFGTALTGIIQTLKWQKLLKQA